MSWIYEQTTGALYQNEAFVCDGYSGTGIGKNNPGMEAVHDVGPIPEGTWTIGPAETHPDLGPVVMALSPDGPAPFGRTGFFIHGDSREHPGNASHGCIIMPRPAREAIAMSGDNVLEVE
jgi:hypothetical protein